MDLLSEFGMDSIQCWYGLMAGEEQRSKADYRFNDSAFRIRCLVCIDMGRERLGDGFDWRRNLSRIFRQCSVFVPS